jgi:arginine decarboxylase
MSSPAFLAKKIFLTAGVGKHREKLSSFEMALRAAGIAQFNLVRVSSIFPPHAKLISKAEGQKLLKPGQILYVVMSENATNEPHRLVAASVGVAIPKDRSQYGYLAEHHSFGQTDAKAGDYAEDLAASMLATVLGVPFDPDQAWDQRREQWMLSGDIVRTLNVTSTAECGDDGRWTTVVAAVAFCG